MSEESKTRDPKEGNPVNKRVKKEWSNPALRMMGIPRFSLPSRNWLIFWSICASIGGGIAYDRYQQKRVREKWVQEVKHLGDEVYTSSRVPRKLTIFIAPPPNDFLDISLGLFKKYIKPLLNASATDFEVFTENRQGDIRAAVAEKIRELRKEKSNGSFNTYNEMENKQPLTANLGALTKVFNKNEQKEEGNLVQRQELYETKDVLGLYRFLKPLEVEYDGAKEPETAGGVICIGRGAYKEYLTGIHEGLLGPLEQPPHLIEEAKKLEEEALAKKETEDKTEEEDKASKPVVKPFITPEHYSNFEVAPELDWNSSIKNKKSIPVLFEQPVYVFPLPTLSGFVNFPRKIYRFFTRRELAADYSERTVGIIQKKTRPFEFKDSLMAKEEETEWPKKWVEIGKEKNSEWIQELVVDDRVFTRMKVFDPSLPKSQKD